MSMLKSKTLCTPVAERLASLPAAKPEPTDAEQAEIRALAKRKKTRRRAPRLKVHQQEGRRLEVMQAGVHADAADAGLKTARGITRNEWGECRATKTANAANLQPPNEPVSIANLNAALAAVTGIAPRDEAEAM